MIVKTLKLCSINIIHLLNRKEELQNYILSNDIHIVCIQETGLRENDHLVVPGYSVIRKDIQANNHRGICTLIKDDIDYQINDWYGDHCVSQIGIKINTSQQGSIDIINYYQDCNRDLNESLFEITVQNSNKFILMGDFNSSHIDIGSSHTNTRGEKLIDILSMRNLFLFNNDNPTFFHRATGNPNILDLAIGTPNLSYNTDFHIGEDVGSDHLPIHIELGVKVPTKDEDSLKRNLTKVDWALYKVALTNNFAPGTINNLRSLDKEINIITNNILDTLDTIAPKRKVKKHGWWAFTDEIKQKVKQRRTIRRLQKKFHTPYYNNLYNKVNREVKLLIEQQKQHDWKLLSTNLNNNNPKKAWDTIKKVTGRTINPNTGKKLLENEEGEKALTSSDKANMMAKHLKQKQSIPEDNFFDQAFRQQVDKYIFKNPEIFMPQISENYADHPLNNFVSLEELEAALKKCNSFSSPGPDKISYIMLKKLPVHIKIHICKIASKCIQWGYFPAKWKCAEIIMIPKPGKDKTKVKNYRPISLISCFGKVIERIITKRLRSYVLENKLISKYQCGFLPKMCTDIHIFRLSQDIYTGLKRKHSTTAIFLDVDGAFDRVWINGLKYKLMDYKLPINFISLLSTFLDNRHFLVKEGHSLSSTIFPTAGTPQGSVLSPLLYVLFTNDFPHPFTNSITISQYADDTAFWYTGKNLKHIQKKLQEYINLIENWNKKWFIKINPSKTQLICFHRNPKQPSIKLYLKNELINQETEINFLGHIFDARLTWSSHLTKIRTTMFRKTNILRSLTGKNWGLNQELLVKIFKAWAIPNVEYGSLAFLSVATSHINKLQTIQNQLIRCAFRKSIMTPVKELHDISHLDTIEGHILKTSTRIFHRIKHHDIVKDSVLRYQASDHVTKHNCPLDILARELGSLF
jgi:hypothetical protein